VPIKSKSMDKELIGSVGIEGISMIRKLDNLEEDQKYYSETPSIATTYMKNIDPSYVRRGDLMYQHMEVSMSMSTENDAAFTVGDPIIGSHVTYSVKGIDNDG